MNITITVDYEEEDDESFDITLSPVGDLVEVRPKMDVAVVTIIDNDAGKHVVYVLPTCKLNISPDTISTQHADMYLILHVCVCVC